MFSRRVPHDLARNRLTEAVADLRARGRDILDLTATNPTRAGFTYPPDLLLPLADARSLEYRPEPLGTPQSRAAVAAEYARRQLLVSPDRVVVTASTSEAYSILFKLLADAGEEILIPRPSYPLFDHLASLDLVVPRAYDLEYHGMWTIDFASLERAISSRTRAVLLVSPNNPTGSFVSARDLDRLADICGARDIAMVADEVFADYELEPSAALSAGRPVDVQSALTFALGGLSKSIGLPQVKLGWIVVGGPSSVAAAALERLELICDTYLSVSTPVQVAAAALLARGGTVRADILRRVTGNYAWLKAAVAASPACRVLPADAGWSAVLHVPTLESEEDLVLRLLADGGVLTHPGYFFDFARESYLVVSLLPEPATFENGIERILRHFDRTVATP